MVTRKWGSETLVNSKTDGQQNDAVVAALKDGTYVVAWTDGAGTSSSIRFQLFDAEGHKVGGERLVVGADGNIYNSPTITVLSDGSFWLGYTHNAGVDNYLEGTVFSSKGTLLREQFSVFDDDRADNLAVAALGTGGVSAWYDPAGKDVVLRYFDSTGVGSTLYNANAQDLGTSTEPNIATSSDGRRVLVSWDEYNFSTQVRTLHANVFDQYGVAKSAEFVRSAKSISAGEVAWLGNSDFLMTWSEVDYTGKITLRAQVFAVENSSIVSRSGAVAIGPIRLTDQSAPAVTVLDGGGFALAWSEFGSQGSDPDQYSIHVQAFDSSGTRIGGDITVNTTTKGAQRYPDIAALADGRLIVTWTDYSQSPDDPSSAAVRSQIIDPRDGLVTGTVKSETLYGHNSIGDEISAGDGNDKAYGLNGDDALYGGDGNDSLSGGKGDDEIYGGRDKDSLTGGSGDDTLDGGAGADIASYSDKTAKVVAVLDNSGNGKVTIGGEVDTLRSIETLVGGSAGDSLTTGSAANTISGGGGNDTIRGGSGRDSMSGGADGDTFYFAKGESGITTPSADVITDWSTADSIDTAIKGTSSNYYEHSVVASVDTVEEAAFYAEKNTGSSIRYAFLYNSTKDVGYLLMDLDSNGAFETGVILNKAGTAAEFSYSDLI